MQWATLLAVEQGQRWHCRSYSPRSTVIVPYSSTQSVNTVPLKAGPDKGTLLYFRRASCSLCCLMDALYLTSCNPISLLLCIALALGLRMRSLCWQWRLHKKLANGVHLNENRF